MGAGLIWAIILGLLATVGLVSLLMWVMIRFPDRASRGPVPAYMRRAGVFVLPKQREAPEYGEAPAKAA